MEMLPMIVMMRIAEMAMLILEAMKRKRMA
jgi:hypothetical protein